MIIGVGGVIRVDIVVAFVYIAPSVENKVRHLKLKISLTRVGKNILFKNGKN